MTTNIEKIDITKPMYFYLVCDSDFIPDTNDHTTSLCNMKDHLNGHAFVSNTNLVSTDFYVTDGELSVAKFNFGNCATVEQFEEIQESWVNIRSLLKSIGKEFDFNAVNITAKQLVDVIRS